VTRPGSIRIGTSGWNYGHWRGIFYPKALPMKRGFQFYSQHLDTVEINNTFYRLPEERFSSPGGNRRRRASSMPSRPVAF
jgi:uncharacterized protein YecE (DUF72 family)